MEKPLHLVKFLVDASRLFWVNRQVALARHGADVGYLVHCLLREAFADMAPKPFAVGASRGRHLEILAYSPHAADALTATARAFGGTIAHEAVQWDSLRSKPMPLRFPAGHRLAFSVRMCPVVRKSSDGPVHKAGAEVDAFLAAAEKAGRGVPLDRESIYRRWFEVAVARGAGMRCWAVRVSSMQRVRLSRRNRSRGVTHLERPDVIFEGHLEVIDPEAFHATLRSGLGRHRAFGFGMLLLRPR